MCGVNGAQGGYGDVLARWCDGLAAGCAKNLLGDVIVGNAADVQRFLLNATEERRRMLTEELSLVALACENFDSLVARYVSEVPRGTYDPENSDPQRFLRWLKRVKQLSASERDFVAYQEAEYACLAMARRHRARHLMFQQLLASPRTTSLGETDCDATVLPNPIRVWSRLVALSSAPAVGSSDAVFFPVGTQIRVLGFAAERAAWLAALIAIAPCPLSIWAARCNGATLPILAAYSRELHDAGLVVVANSKEAV